MVVALAGVVALVPYGEEEEAKRDDDRHSRYDERSLKLISKFHSA